MSEEMVSKSHDTLLQACGAFLSEVLPAKNVITEVHMKEFLPLFNKELFENLKPHQLEELMNKYHMRFSMQHPIQIISHELDPNGVYYPETDKKHKLLQTLPPVFRSIKTINTLGGDATDLIAMFYSTTKNATPINDKTPLVRDAMIRAILKANEDDMNDEAAQQAYAAQVASIENRVEDNTTESVVEENEGTGVLTDDMPWE